MNTQSDTPRTDLNCLTVEALRTMKGTGTKIVLAAVARDLERELASVHERIKRLEETADNLLELSYDCDCRGTGIAEARLAYRHAKEAKP